VAGQEVDVQDNKASRIFLGVAIALGILAMLMAFAFINEAEGQDRGPKAWVVVAKRDLQPSVDIDPDRDLKKEEIPQTFSRLLANTLDPNALASYRGQKLNRGVPADQPVFLADFAAAAEVAPPPPGYVDLTITAIPGVVAPGNYVKIMSVSGQVLAGDVAFRVVAISGQTRLARPLTWGEQPNSQSNSAKAVTIEATEAQAAELVKGMGTSAEKVHLLLCPPAQGAASRGAP
jgi:hypothetical protein